MGGLEGLGESLEESAVVLAESIRAAEERLTEFKERSEENGGSVNDGALVKGPDSKKPAPRVQKRLKVVGWPWRFAMRARAACSSAWFAFLNGARWFARLRYE